MNKNKILVTQSSLPDFNEYCEEIREIWDTHILTNMGVKHQKLEKELLKFLSVPNITLFTNGHLALEYIIEAMNLSGEIITIPFTFASTTHAIIRNGITPVFCDINSYDYTIDVKKIENLITEKTTAILPVHVYGNLCDVEKIALIAKKYNLKVIYDAAHAFGVEKKGIGVGNFGDASMFSFHATKVFNTIEGGAVVYKDDTLTEKMKAFKNFGIMDNGEIRYAGGNAKMNEFQAAMGLCNLKHLETEILKRKKIVERYKEKLKNVEGIRFSEISEEIKSNYAYFPILLDGYKYTRDEIFEKLSKQNIFTRKYFYPLISDFECYRDNYDSKKTPIAKFVADRILTLPLYASLELDIVDRICDIILL